MTTNTGIDVGIGEHLFTGDGVRKLVHQLWKSRLLKILEIDFPHKPDI